MPIVTWLLGGLARMFGPMVIKFLIGVGVGIATFSGVKALIDSAKALVLTQIGSMSGDVINLLSLLKVDVAINILFSALIVRLTLKGMSAAGSIASWKLGG